MCPVDVDPNYRDAQRRRSSGIGILEGAPNGRVPLPMHVENIATDEACRPEELDASPWRWPSVSAGGALDARRMHAGEWVECTSPAVAGGVPIAVFATAHLAATDTLPVSHGGTRHVGAYLTRAARGGNVA